MPLVRLMTKSFMKRLLFYLVAILAMAIFTALLQARREHNKISGLKPAIQLNADGNRPDSSVK